MASPSSPPYFHAIFHAIFHQFSLQNHPAMGVPPMVDRRRSPEAPAELGPCGSARRNATATVPGAILRRCARRAGRMGPEGSSWPEEWGYDP